MHFGLKFNCVYHYEGSDIMVKYLLYCFLDEEILESGPLRSSGTLEGLAENLH